jgi:hypothetical protein
MFRFEKRLTGDVSQGTGRIVMLSENIRPSTIDGIKRLANSIKKERGIKHLAALDEVARLTLRTWWPCVWKHSMQTACPKIID